MTLAFIYSCLSFSNKLVPQSGQVAICLASSWSPTKYGWPLGHKKQFPSEYPTATLSIKLFAILDPPLFSYREESSASFCCTRGLMASFAALATTDISCFQCGPSVV